MGGKKLLIIHPALAPYRIDQFNALNKFFDLEVIFIFKNVWNHKFNQEKLLSELECKYTYLSKGPSYKGRVFRFGILKKIKQNNPDIIIGYEYSFTTLYLIFLKKTGFIKQSIGTFVDDSLQLCENVQTIYRNLSRKFALKRLNFIVVLSTNVADYYRNKFNIDSNKIIISPILQNPSRLRSNKKVLENEANKYISQHKLKEKKVLLFVGRFIPEKGLYLFIKNISELLANNTQIKLILVGDGSERENLKNEIEKLKLSKSIILPGRFEGNELLAWYLCASGFILPSTLEPFGAVVNEALIFGIPILCSKYVGAASLITNTARGTLFDPLDSNDTKEKFSLFVHQMKILKSSKLTHKESLFDFDFHYFKTSWSKIIND